MDVSSRGNTGRNPDHFWDADVWWTNSTCASHPKREIKDLHLNCSVNSTGSLLGFGQWKKTKRGSALFVFTTKSLPSTVLGRLVLSIFGKYHGLFSLGNNVSSKCVIWKMAFTVLPHVLLKTTPGGRFALGVSGIREMKPSVLEGEAQLWFPRAEAEGLSVGTVLLPPQSSGRWLGPSGLPATPASNHPAGAPAGNSFLYLHFQSQNQNQKSKRLDKTDPEMEQRSQTQDRYSCFSVFTVPRQKGEMEPPSYLEWYNLNDLPKK